MKNFVEIGLDPDSQLLHTFRISTGFRQANGKYLDGFWCSKKLYFGIFLDLNFKFFKLFGIT